jgi:hypothetical protein
MRIKTGCPGLDNLIGFTSGTARNGNKSNVTVFV